jgi:hypothetical protein
LKVLSILLFSAITLSSFKAHAKLEAQVINSPVKETYLKVKIDGVDSVSSVYFKPKNGGQEVTGQVDQENGQTIAKLKTSELKPGQYEYRIKVRSQAGNSDQSRAASVEIIVFSIDSSLEVSDPGEEGRKTLLGIDSDNDGLRDDIQRYLNEKYSDKSNMKLALEQYAKTYKDVFSTLENKIANIEATNRTLDSIECLMGIINPEQASISGNELKRRITNTKNRLLADKKADLNYSGQSRELSKDKLSKCKFQIQ